MKTPAQYFRAGVGAVIVDHRGSVLAFERADFLGAWQLPQGGLKEAEEPLDAVHREITEETGIRPQELQLLDTFPHPLAYELPAALRTRKTGLGQVQYWFLFRFLGSTDTLELNRGREFRAWAWMSFTRLLKMVAEFRRPVYEQLATRFEPRAAKPLAKTRIATQAKRSAGLPRRTRRSQRAAAK